MQKFTFGKHKGKSVLKVIFLQPNYVWWAHNTVDTFKLNYLEYLILLLNTSYFGKAINYFLFLLVYVFFICIYHPTKNLINYVKIKTTK
jgi:hypothetical protein